MDLFTRVNLVSRHGSRLGFNVFPVTIFRDSDRKIMKIHRALTYLPALTRAVLGSPAEHETLGVNFTPPPSPV